MKLKRLKTIESYLIQQETVTLDELASILDVSLNTVRRDVQELVKLGVAQRVHGGAMLSVDRHQVPSYDARTMLNTPSKRSIGRKAGELIRDGSVVFVDAGSTAWQVLTSIPINTRATVITASRSAVNTAVQNRNLHVVCIGGEYYPDSDAFVGLEAIREIKNHGIEVAFLSANGICPRRGLTNASRLEAEVKRSVIEIARTVVLMVDRSKFNQVAFAWFGNIADIDVLITDSAPTGELETALNQAKVDIQIAPGLPE